MSEGASSGGRYQRSMGGMVGAMIITVGVIVAFVLFRAANRDSVDVGPEAIDYLPIVEGIQASGSDAGMDVLYPAELPKGWIATAATFDPAVLWSMSVLTDEEHYLGIRQGPGKVNDFVEEYVDEDATQGKDVALTSADGEKQTWQRWSDDEGDEALVRTAPLATKSGEQTGIEVVTLVVGTAGEDTLMDFVEDLTAEPVK